MSFEQWFATFLAEKGYDMQQKVYSVDIGGFWGNLILGGEVLYEAIIKAPSAEQRAIRDTLVRIDFANGDINDFFTHLAGVLGKAQFCWED